MATASRFAVSNWQLPAASEPTVVAAVADAGLVFHVDTHQRVPAPSSALATPQSYIPRNSKTLPDVVPAIFLGSAFAVADPLWYCVGTLPLQHHDVIHRMLRPVERFLKDPPDHPPPTTLPALIAHTYAHCTHCTTINRRHRSSAILDALVSRPASTHDLLLADGDQRVRAFLRHDDAMQVPCAHDSFITVQSTAAGSIRQLRPTRGCPVARLPAHAVHGCHRPRAQGRQHRRSRRHQPGTDCSSSTHAARTMVSRRAHQLAVERGGTRHCPRLGRLNGNSTTANNEETSCKPPSTSSHR